MSEINFVFCPRCGRQMNPAYDGSQIDGPITEDWLKANGFKWHQVDRQPGKHWVLWIGAAFKVRKMFQGPDDLGLELGPGSDGEWFCWFRSDTAGRYHRFIHIRHLKTTDELRTLISALIGYEFDPRNALYGSLHRPDVAEHLRKEYERLDLKWRHEARDSAKWSEVEKDDSRGRALPEHLEAHEKAKQNDQQ